MKPILFAKDETDFTTNGLGRLDCISCRVIEERNGMYELEAEIPIDGAHTSEIEQQSIIGVIPHDGGTIQAFYVYKITKPISGRFSVYARHISYRLTDIPCEPFSIETSPSACANTLAGLKSHAVEACPFTFWTDNTTGSPYNQPVPASIRQRLGGVEGSVLDQFGGEYEWDNWTVKLHNKRGRLANVTGITLRYGKNIIDINQEEEIATTVTGIMPYWIDTEGNNLVMLPERVIYSDHAADFPYHLTQVMNFSDKYEEKPTQAQLRSATNAYMSKTGFGVPKVSIKVSFVDLWKSEEYKDIAPLEQVQLCDEVTVLFEDLGISEVAEVVKTDWDVLKERYNSIEVGSLRTTLAQAVTDRDKEIDSEFLSQMTRIATAIADATAWLTNAKGYVIAIKNEDGSWKELIFANTNSTVTATAGIRINNAGIGFWNKALHGGNVLDGPYGMAWTMDGRFGDLANKNFWNLLTGAFSLSPTTTVGGKTVDTIANEKAQAAAQSAEAAAEAAAAAALAEAMRLVNLDIEDLQAQIDGNVTTWFYDYVPTTSNAPASTWVNAQDPTDPTIMINHIGDLFYDSDTGYCYRWQVKSSAADPTHPTVNDFEWVKISDSDIEAALREAGDAWDLADKKRRVFVTQPTPPYDVGDLWAQGGQGDLKRCVTAKTATQSYDPTDWVLATKYTDDSALTAWISTTYADDQKALVGQIDGKAETWYQDTDPSLDWSAEEVKGLTITFNPNCNVEIGSGGYMYDYIEIYWKEAGNNTYSKITKGGNFGGQSINIPGGEFWVYWHTDSSQHDYYGWKIDTVDKYDDSSYTTPTQSGISSLPAYTPVDKAIGELESAHPYTDSINDLYHVLLKFSHVGDLWYKTTDDTTWYFDGAGWIQQNVPKAVFDEIDGKAQIFTSQPTPPYNVGDLWFNSSTSDIMTCINAKASGSFIASDWEKRNKYTDDSAVTALDNRLTQEEVYNRLTNNGQAKGLFLTGQDLYFNATYINTGSMSADLINTGNLFVGREDNGFFAACFASNVTQTSDEATWIYLNQLCQSLGEGTFVVMVNVTFVEDDATGYYTVFKNSAEETRARQIQLKEGWNRINYKFDLNYSSNPDYKILMGAGSGHYDYTAYVYKTHTIIDETGLKTFRGEIGSLTLESGNLYAMDNIEVVNLNVYSVSSPYEQEFRIIPSSDFTQTTQLRIQYAECDHGSTYTPSYAALRIYVYDDTLPTSHQSLEYRQYNAGGEEIDGKSSLLNTVFYPSDNREYIIHVALSPGTNYSNYRVLITAEEEQETTLINKDEIKGRHTGRFEGKGFFNYVDFGGFLYDPVDWRLSGLKIIGNTLAFYDQYNMNTTPSEFVIVGSDKITMGVSDGTFTFKTQATYSPLEIKLQYNSNRYMDITYSAIERKISSATTQPVMWDTSSDKRLKEDIEPLDEMMSVNLINATETKRFKYIEQDGTHYGMIAQDVRKILDSLGEEDAQLECEYNSEGYRKISYDEYIPPMINYIKWLEKRVTALEEKLAKLNT